MHKKVSFRLRLIQTPVEKVIFTLLTAVTGIQLYLYIVFMYCSLGALADEMLGVYN
jgi:hypothetical protein